MRPILTTGVLIFATTLVIYFFCLNGVWAVDHATSFLQLDYAIWTHHSFVLGSGSSFKPDSVDDFEYKGNYYSALAPGTAILAFPMVSIGFILDGHFTVFGYATLFSEFFVAMMNSFAAVLVYLTARLFFAKRTSALLGFAYAFSTISWPFATYFFQSDVSATFCLLAAYLGLRSVRGKDGHMLYAVLAGLSVATAMLVDYIDAVFLMILPVYITLELRRRKEPFVKPVVGFLLTACLGLLLVGAYNYVNFGSPFSGTEQLYLHASSVFDEFSYPLYLGAYLNLFSPFRGLLVYSVFLVLGVFGFYEMVRDSAYRLEALLFLACFLGIFIPYSMWYDPTGGEGFGPRFLVAAIPFLVLPAGITIERGDRKLVVIAYALYAVGAVINGIAGLTSAVTPMLRYGMSGFLSWTLPLFLRGGGDTWWMRYVSGDWEVPSVVIITAALVIPVIADRMLLRKQRPPTHPTLDERATNQ